MKGFDTTLNLNGTITQTQNINQGQLTNNCLDSTQCDEIVHFDNSIKIYSTGNIQINTNICDDI